VTEAELIADIRKNHRCRNQKLAEAVRGGAVRVNRERRLREKCSICTIPERAGRGLLLYRQANGEELFLGGKCALYLDYLRTHTALIRELGLES